MTTRRRRAGAHEGQQGCDAVQVDIPEFRGLDHGSTDLHQTGEMEHGPYRVTPYAVRQRPAVADIASHKRSKLHGLREVEDDGLHARRRQRLAGVGADIAPLVLSPTHASSSFSLSRAKTRGTRCGSETPPRLRRLTAGEAKPRLSLPHIDQSCAFPDFDPAPSRHAKELGSAAASSGAWRGQAQKLGNRIAAQSEISELIYVAHPAGSRAHAARCLCPE